MTDALRLLAQDSDDLQIISAALQDAVVRMADISFAPAARTLTFPFTRFRWEAETPERVQAAIQFGDVLGVKMRGMDPSTRDGVCSLLALEFVPGEEAPGGAVILQFAGCGDLRLDVECLDAAMTDLCDPWPTKATPEHGA